MPRTEPAEEAVSEAPQDHTSAATDNEDEPQEAEHTPSQDGTNTPWWVETTPPVETSLPHKEPAHDEHGTKPLLASVTEDESQLIDPALTADDPRERDTAPLAFGQQLPAQVTLSLAQERADETMILNSTQGLAAAALRDVGQVRQINQDSVFALLTTLPRESGDVSLGLFIVADGMGGHDGGEVASRLAISSVARYLLAQIVLPTLEDAPVEALQPVMIAAVQEANRAIWDHAQSVHSDMGTTCTAVLMLGSALYIGHVGDSRAYVLEPGGLHLLTADHSAVGRLIQVGQLDPSEAREHPMRSQLYRTVGQQPQVQVDFVRHSIGQGTHLLLGSDGLWGMLNEEQMATTLRSYAWPQDACRALVAEANAAGGEDNISAVVVSFPVAQGAAI